MPVCGADTLEVRFLNSTVRGVCMVRGLLEGREEGRCGLDKIPYAAP